MLTFGIRGISKSTPDGEIKYWGDAAFVSKGVNQLTSNVGIKVRNESEVGLDNPLTRGRILRLF